MPVVDSMAFVFLAVLCRAVAVFFVLSSLLLTFAFDKFIIVFNIYALKTNLYNKFVAKSERVRL